MGQLFCIWEVMGGLGNAPPSGEVIGWLINSIQILQRKVTSFSANLSAVARETYEGSLYSSTTLLSRQYGELPC